eukprot:6212186-Pleurochrysis_carterae.AAC.1
MCDCRSTSTICTAAACRLLAPRELDEDVHRRPQSPRRSDGPADERHVSRETSTSARAPASRIMLT